MPGTLCYIPLETPACYTSVALFDGVDSRPVYKPIILARAYVALRFKLRQRMSAKHQSEITLFAHAESNPCSEHHWTNTVAEASLTPEPP